MKKLTVFVLIMLIAGLLAGCWVLPESKLISICVDPKSMDLVEPSTQGLDYKIQEAVASVTANYSDGNSEDIKLTDCEYLSRNSDVAVVDVDNEGDAVWIRAIGAGETVILVSYTQHNAWTGRRTEVDTIDVFVEPAK